VRKKPQTIAIFALAFLLSFAGTNSLAAQDAKSSQSMEYELALQRGTQAVISGVCRRSA
jgi:hypothetical protein